MSTVHLWTKSHKGGQKSLWNILFKEYSPEIFQDEEICPAFGGGWKLVARTSF